VDRLYRFLHRENAAAAQRAASLILKSATHLESFPELGIPVSGTPGFREIYAAYGHGGYVI
jgi:plasmid stabilization system protein ParE